MVALMPSILVQQLNSGLKLSVSVVLTSAIAALWDGVLLSPANQHASTAWQVCVSQVSQLSSSKHKFTVVTVQCLVEVCSVNQPEVSLVSCKYQEDPKGH